jgi:hypothetical protein
VELQLLEKKFEWEQLQMLEVEVLVQLEKQVQAR